MFKYIKYENGRNAFLYQMPNYVLCIFLCLSPHAQKTPKKQNKNKKTKTNGKCYLNILFNDESKHKIIVETLDKCYRNGKTSVFVTYHCEKRIVKEERNR